MTLISRQLYLGFDSGTILEPKQVSEISAVPGGPNFNPTREATIIQLSARIPGWHLSLAARKKLEPPVLLSESDGLRVYQSESQRPLVDTIMLMRDLDISWQPILLEPWEWLVLTVENLLDRPERFFGVVVLEQLDPGGWTEREKERLQ